MRNYNRPNATTLTVPEKIRAGLQTARQKYGKVAIGALVAGGVATGLANGGGEAIVRSMEQHGTTATLNPEQSASVVSDSKRIYDAMAQVREGMAADPTTQVQETPNSRILANIQSNLPNAKLVEKSAVTFDISEDGTPTLSLELNRFNDFDTATANDMTETFSQLAEEFAVPGATDLNSALAQVAARDNRVPTSIIRQGDNGYGPKGSDYIFTGPANALVVEEGGWGDHNYNTPEELAPEVPDRMASYVETVQESRFYPE